MRLLVLISVLGVIALNASSEPKLVAPGDVEAGSLKCTVCKYTLEYICNTFLNPKRRSGKEFYEQVTDVFEKMCYTIGVDDSCCEDRKKFEKAVDEILNTVAQTLENTCSLFDNTCPENTPKCGPQPKPDEFHSMIKPKKSRRVDESSVRVVVDQLFKVSPNLRSVIDRETLTKEVVKAYKP